MTPEATLHRKLAEITEEIGVVEKGGFNDFHKYKYVEERHVLEMVRGKLAAKRIVLLPSVTAVSERGVTTAKGKQSTVTTLHVRFTFVDAESRETHECDWVGQGDDAGDKGVNKAATSALKYFLLKAFLIPTGEPDPEGDKTTDERAAERNGDDGYEREGSIHIDPTPVTIGRDEATKLYELAKSEPSVDWALLQRAVTHQTKDDPGDLSGDDAIKRLMFLTEAQSAAVGAWIARKALERTEAEAKQATLK